MLGQIIKVLVFGHLEYLVAVPLPLSLFDGRLLVQLINQLQSIFDLSLELIGLECLERQLLGVEGNQLIEVLLETVLDSIEQVLSTVMPQTLEKEVVSLVEVVSHPLIQINHLRLLDLPHIRVYRGLRLVNELDGILLPPSRGLSRDPRRVEVRVDAFIGGHDLRAEQHHVVLLAWRKHVSDRSQRAILDLYGQGILV